MPIYRRATVEDIPILTEYRMDLLHSAINKEDPAMWQKVRSNVTQYYKEAIPSEEHVAYLAYGGDVCVGTGGVCFYRILPTFYKPVGKKAYIINMYTVPAFRRIGIASHILKLLVQEAVERGATYISLEATQMGRPLYEKNGFGYLHSEMQYMNETYEG